MQCIQMLNLSPRTPQQIWLPLPDYASRCLLWPALFSRYGAHLPDSFDLSTLAHVSEGYASGGLDAVVVTLMTARRKITLSKRQLDVAEVLQWLCKAEPISKEADELLRK